MDRPFPVASERPIMTLSRRMMMRGAVAVAGAASAVPALAQRGRAALVEERARSEALGKAGALNEHEGQVLAVEACVSQLKTLSDRKAQVLHALDAAGRALDVVRPAGQSHTARLTLPSKKRIIFCFVRKGEGSFEESLR